MQRVLVALSLILCTSCGGTVSAGDDQTPADGHDAGPASDASEASVVGDAGGGYDAVVPPAGQKILFESSYVNYAWQPSVSGFYVTADGTVYKYDYYASAPPDAGYPYTEYGPSMTEAQVTGKYGTAATVFGKLDANELHERLGALGAARGGTLLTQGTCADFGVVRYAGYIYDSATATYTPVLLGAHGDMAVKNTAPEAQALLEWFRDEIGDAQQQGFCEFQELNCALPACPDADACKQGWVPVSHDETGCAQSCGSPSMCEQVSSCDVCGAANEACLRDQGGNAHCVRWVEGCSYGEVDCACGGDSLCAGGEAYCHGDPHGGMSCVAP